MINKDREKAAIHRSGFAAVIGKPNAGKSTLVNALAGTKVAITSPRPQTTRHRIMGVRTNPGSQIIFVDTPGVVTASNELDSFMEKIYTEESRQSDAVLFVADGSVKCGDDDRKAAALLAPAVKTGVPVFLILNKSDRTKNDANYDEYRALGKFSAEFIISAKEGEGLEKLVSSVSEVLPEGPQYFPPDMHTDQSPELFAAETVREHVLKLIDEEIPHGVFAFTEEMREGKTPGTTYIRVHIYVERESHKGIIIGKNGKMLKKIGEGARKELAERMNCKIFLDLWVKVKDKWKNRRDLLRSWGYE
ncbi:MAG: GTPase Era [bacterium]|nr:GTPase Era [bacterium]